jgi:hypothetical protein
LPPGAFRRRILERGFEAWRLEGLKAWRLGGLEAWRLEGMTMTRCAIVAAMMASASLAVRGGYVLEARTFDPSVKDLVARTEAYVSGFESQLAFGVFDEDYTQADDAGTGHLERTMQGELFLTFLPTDKDWIAVHDVAEVDGQPVPDRESLQALLQRAPLQSVGREVATRNARFNIGTITRNFNEPTLALLVLEPVRASTFDFSIEGISDDGTGTLLATLRFREKGDGLATLIRGPENEAAKSAGDFIVEVRTGRIRQTHFTVDLSDTSASLTTFFARDAHSDLWLPALFQERYERKKNGPHEVITCESKYTNFRRFEVLGKIKGN